MAQTAAQSRAKKFTMAKTKKGLLNTLYLVAGMVGAGMIEQHAMSKIAFLADTKTVDATTSPNTLGVIIKSAIYVVGGLLPSQLTDNDALTWAGYGVSAYGGAKLAKGLTEKAKIFGLGRVNGLYPHVDPLPQYQLPSSVPSSK